MTLTPLETDMYLQIDYSWSIPPKFRLTSGAVMSTKQQILAAL